MTDPESSPRPRRAAAFGFIYATAIMNSISFGIMIPILPNLIKQLAGGDTASASEWNVLFATTWGAMQFVFGPILGMLSDRYGRRPVLLISIFGLFVDFLFMAFAPTLEWLFVGRILNGITAGSFSTANAYVADITEPDKRAKFFGIMGSAFGFGFIIGPTIGGILGEHNLRLPFIAAAGLCLLNGLYGLFVLPESLSRALRTPKMVWARANPLSSLLFLREHGHLMGLAVVGFLFQLTQNVLPTIFVLYTGFRYHWTPQILGFTFMASGIAQVLVIGLQGDGLPWPAAAGLVLLLGAGVGLANGLLVTFVGIDSFIATLGMGTLIYGFNEWYTGGQQVVATLPDSFLAISGAVVGIPLPALYVGVRPISLWTTITSFSRIFSSSARCST